MESRLVVRLVVLLAAVGTARLKQQGARLQVHVVTWNAGGTNKPEALETLLGVYGRGRPDLVVVGLQEASQLLKLAFHWRDAMSHVLGPKGYYLVGTSEMMGMLLLVFAQTKHRERIKEVRSQTVGTGWFGLGNKGGVLLHLELYGAPVCLVNSHLAPHDEGFQDRLSMYRAINHVRKKHCDERRDRFTFWLGDLNFRLKKPLDDKKIVSLVKQKHLDELLRQDELISVIKEKKAFQNFLEPKITFNPTFKLKVPTDSFDLKRRPAWTDRILYQAKNLESLKVTKYSSLPSYKSSDHKPVAATFSIII